MQQSLACVEYGIRAEAGRDDRKDKPRYQHAWPAFDLQISEVL